jgi:GH24 family phage-related lysozyme (muramidase)
MNLSARGAAFIRAHEGFVAKYYLDPVGVGTIGIGFTWASKAFQQWWAKHKTVRFGPGATMTKAEAEAALIYLCAEEYGNAVNAHYGKAVPQHVFDASTSVTFNCGPGTLSDRWAQAAKAGNYNTAAALLETTRTTAKGKKLAGLVRRRKEEALLLRDGRYTGVAATPAVPVSDGVLERGERGPEVAKLIVDLAKLGYYKGVKDDVFGPGTEAAVMAFQRAAGIKVDGAAGPLTLAAIAAAMPVAPAVPAQPAAGQGILDTIIAALKRLLGV